MGLVVVMALEAAAAGGAAVVARAAVEVEAAAVWVELAEVELAQAQLSAAEAVALVAPQIKSLEGAQEIQFVRHGVTRYLLHSASTVLAAMDADKWQRMALLLALDQMEGAAAAGRLTVHQLLQAPQAATALALAALAALVALVVPGAAV